MVLKTLTISTYPFWRPQFNTLFFVCDLLGCINGSFARPLLLITSNGSSIANLGYTLWLYQD